MKMREHTKTRRTQAAKQQKRPGKAEKEGIGG
jgi:hypothetical protein